jgi:glycosyltransferase involved in cell wall biosynthesis
MSIIKKIIFFIPNVERGGIEKNFLILTKYFVNKNYKVEILCSKISKNILLKIDKKIIIKKSKNFFNLINIFFSNRIINSICCFLYFCCKLKKENDAVIFSMQDHPFAIILGKIKNINCIIRIANHPEVSLKLFNNKILFHIKLYIKIFFYRYAKVIICNSKSSSAFLKKKIKNDIITIYNPLNLKNFNKKKERLNYLLSIGRLEKQKNFSGLIEAFYIVLKKFPNFKLIIIGSGKEKNKLIEKVNKLEIKDKVIFKKFMRPDYFFLKSKIFILNSFFEGMPNVILESLLNKCPVISTNCESGPKEILKNEKFGYLVRVNDHVNLSNKIKYVLSNYGIAKKKAALGHKSLNRFELNSQCLKYKAIVDSSFS